MQQKNHISFIFWKWKLVTIRRTYVWNGILKYSQLKSRYFVVLAIWLKESFFYITHPTEETSKNDQIDTCSNASSSSTFDGKPKKERDMNMNYVYKHFSVWYIMMVMMNYLHLVIHKCGV